MMKDHSDAGLREAGDVPILAPTAPAEYGHLSSNHFGLGCALVDGCEWR
jgi:hypothetical protein